MQVLPWQSQASLLSSAANAPSLGAWRLTSIVVPAKAVAARCILPQTSDQPPAQWHWRRRATAWTAFVAGVALWWPKAQRCPVSHYVNGPVAVWNATSVAIVTTQILVAVGATVAILIMSMWCRPSSSSSSPGRATVDLSQSRFTDPSDAAYGTILEGREL